MEQRSPLRPTHDVSTRKPYMELQQLQIPFQAPNRGPCSASVKVQPNDDPLRTGQQLLDLDYPPETAKGFPIIEITVSSAVSRGYAAMYGWIQVVATGTADQPYGPLPDDLSSAPWTMDPVGITENLDTPFVWFGLEPSLFDGPSRSDVKDLDWVARCFLCYLDDAVGNGSAESRSPKPVLVVQWGFWIEEYEPLVKKVEQLDVRVWNQHLALFRSKFPNWQFVAIKA
ncbi:MAG: hypothetical protein M1820_003897 [Bogoriella megaspora]|nr:MAG: hypothetical protein M1820_003897 [Bogoriella megaspora]